MHKKTEVIKFIVRGYILSIIFFLHSVCSLAQMAVKEYQLPASEIRGEVFNIRADEVKLRAVPFKDIHYVHFELLKPTVLTVSVSSGVTGYEINPKRNIEAKPEENKLVISIRKADYYVIRINGRHTLFVFAESPVSGVSPEDRNVKNVMDYGVDNSGKTCETTKLQQALDDISVNRLTLYFPRGIYKTGTLKIKSNSRVFLDAGAVLQGSEKIEDYPVDSGRTEYKNFNDAGGKDNGEIMTFSRLILIDNARDVKLWGRGVIDGNGAIIRNLGKPANLIRIRNSSYVFIGGLTLRDPAAWNTHILYSNHVQLSDIKILNDPTIRNTDGIDPDASRNVRINHCFAYCADDNIAIKSSNNSDLLQNVKNISVENCVFLTRKSALKIGTETKSAKISKVVFKNNEVIEADRGIALYCYDGATFRNIKFIGNRFVYGFEDLKQKAIHFEIRDRSGKGAIKNVVIKDCVFEKTFHSSSQISGLSAGHFISNVRFKNITLNNKVCTSLAELNIRMNGFVKNIGLKK